MSIAETIYIVHWEGPFKWNKVKSDNFIKPGHVLYALYGIHHLYGQRTLLYLGKTSDFQKNPLLQSPRLD
jgi:hypothetical protein